MAFFMSSDLSTIFLFLRGSSTCPISYEVCFCPSVGCVDSSKLHPTQAPYVCAQAQMQSPCTGTGGGGKAAEMISLWLWLTWLKETYFLTVVELRFMNAPCVNAGPGSLSCFYITVHDLVLRLTHTQPSLSRTLLFCFTFFFCFPQNSRAAVSSHVPSPNSPHGPYVACVRVLDEL